MTTANYPSKKQIIRAQERRIPEHIMGCDFDEAHERCWCCGKKRKTERAHMTPASLGGSNDPDNFVLLCRACHAESPDVNKQVMLAWLERESSGWHGDRLPRKALMAAISRHGVSPLCSTSGDEIQEKLSGLRSSCSSHFREGVSAGTYEWICEELFSGLADV